MEYVHKNRIYNIFSIIDEIKYLEGRTTVTATKPAKPLHKQLKGFWHKHHLQSRFIVRNLINHWELKNDSHKFDELWQKLVKKTGSEFMEAFINKLTDELVHKGFLKRMQEHKATGEWIIFAPHYGKNYYLTLASHTEKSEAISKRLADNYAGQFPFLFVKRHR